MGLCESFRKLTETPHPMASELGISHNTVTRHVANIMRKMEAGNRTEAVLNAIRQRLISFV